MPGGVAGAPGVVLVVSEHAKSSGLSVEMSDFSPMFLSGCFSHDLPHEILLVVATLAQSAVVPGDVTGVPGVLG